MNVGGLSWFFKKVIIIYSRSWEAAGCMHLIFLRNVFSNRMVGRKLSTLDKIEPGTKSPCGSCRLLIFNGCFRYELPHGLKWNHKNWNRIQIWGIWDCKLSYCLLFSTENYFGKIEDNRFWNPVKRKLVLDRSSVIWHANVTCLIYLFTPPLLT